MKEKYVSPELDVNYYDPMPVLTGLSGREGLENGDTGENLGGNG